MLFDIIGTKGELHKLTLDYMNMIYYGMPFFFLVMVLNGMLNAVGDTKTFGKALVFGFFLNLLLDPLFMYGWFGLPAMGVAGVAFATVITQIVNTIWLGKKTLEHGILSLRLDDYRPMVATWKKLLDQSIPSTMMHASVSIGFLIVSVF